MAPLLDTNGVVDAWLTVTEAVALGVASRRSIYRHLASKTTTSRQRGRELEYRVDDMPVVVQQALVQYHARRSTEIDGQLRTELAGDAVTARLARFDEPTREAFLGEAARRYRVLLAWDAVNPKKLNGELTPEALAVIDDWRCTDPRILVVRPAWGEPLSVASFYRVLDAVRRHGAVALIPEAPKAQRPDDRRLRPLSDVVIAAMKRVLIQYPHASTESRHRKLVDEFADDAPSLSRFKRFLHDQIPTGVRTLVRDGNRKFEATAAPYIHRDYSSLDVCEWLCGDEHQFDFQIIDPRNGELLRPWLTMFSDLRTRAPVGWSISFDHNTETIIDAFIHAVRPKKDPAFEFLCGLPSVIYVDNGKDYRSARFEYLLAQHQIKVVHALPYNAKAKNVERVFGTIAVQFSRDQLTWFGNRPEQRPGRYPELVAQHERWRKNASGAATPFMSMSELKVRFADYVVEYLGRKNDGLRELDTGRERSPLDVSRDRRTPARIPLIEHLEFTAMERFQLTVNRGQVKTNGFFYRHAELLKFDGRKVYCRRSADDVRTLLVYTLEDKLICRAEAAELVKLSSGELPATFFKEIGRVKREKRRIKDAFYDLREKELSGDADAIALPPPAPSPATPGSSAAVAGADATIAFQPQIARAVREARAAIAPAPEPSADVIAFVSPPVSPSPSSDELDDLYARELLGPRPDPGKYFMSKREEERAIEAQEDWDRMRLEIIAERRNKRAAKAM